MDRQSVHLQVLEAARRVAGRTRTFRLRDVVAALPHLNPGTVRTHVSSRCCVNAPAHHQTRWPYFRAVGRGVYRLEPRDKKRRAGAPRGNRSWQDRILDAGDFGIDPTLITANLRRTPTERLQQLVSFIDFIETARAANASRLRASVQSAR
jgi:hypothetical protein